MPALTRVAALAEVPEGELKVLDVEGKRICLAKVDGEVYAFQDNCSHRDFPLSEGELDPDDLTVTCEWHGAMFDIRTGAALTLPATRPIKVYPVQVEGEDIYVELEE
jgi:3-phenylpropionate/trans-cinnamate dioxygenase ferredoxin component